MSTNEIVQIIMSYLPTVIAVVGIVVSAMKMFSSIKKSTKEIKQMKEFKEVKDQVKIVVQENIELRREIAELLQAYTGVKKSCKNQTEPKNTKG